MNYKKSLMMLTCTMLMEFTAGCVTDEIHWGMRMRNSGVTYIEKAFSFMDTDLFKVILATAGLMVLIILLHWKEVKRDAKAQFAPFSPISQKYEAWEDEVRAKRRERKKK